VETKRSVWLCSRAIWSINANPAELLLSHCSFHSSSHCLKPHEQYNQTSVCFRNDPLKWAFSQVFLFRVFIIRANDSHSSWGCTNNQLVLHQDQHIIEEASLAASPWPPLFSSGTSAICSSPAARLNCRAPSGTYRWFTTVVCLNILSCTPLNHFTLKSLVSLIRARARCASAGHDTWVSAALCSMMHNV